MPKLKTCAAAAAALAVCAMLQAPAAAPASLRAATASAPDAILRIASMTKPITSAVVMMLRDEGRLDVEDPVTKYLPEFSGVRVMTSFDEADRTFESRPPARPITIRHLLTHTSGIAYSFV